MSERIFVSGCHAFFTAASDVVGHGQGSAPVQQDFDDLVVVAVGRQHEGGDVGGEGRRVRRDRLPTLQ